VKTYGEGFDQQLEGLPGKPGRLIKRADNRQPGAVVLDLNVGDDGLDPYGLPIRPLRVDQPRTPGQLGS
jgi:hypothetical protein